MRSKDELTFGCGKSGGIEIIRELRLMINDGGLKEEFSLFEFILLERSVYLSSIEISTIYIIYMNCRYF